ncbi:MAG: hypothetical protein QXJ69_02870 [Desulfurococcaceae archaeon]
MNKAKKNSEKTPPSDTFEEDLYEEMVMEKCYGCPLRGVCR